MGRPKTKRLSNYSWAVPTLPMGVALTTKKKTWAPNYSVGYQDYLNGIRAEFPQKENKIQKC